MTESGDVSKPTPVSIVIVRRGSRFLVRVRPPGGPMPGVHEFAGGKSEPGESAEATAIREAFEEIGMNVRLVGLRRRFQHRYAHGFVDLSYFDAELDPADAEPAAESGFRWVEAAALSALTFPPANEPIIAELVRERGTCPSRDLSE